MATSIEILVVEDEFLVAEDIIGRLTDMGYKVVGHATSAPEALQIVEQTHPDLVLMDIDIKGSKNGIETAHKLNQLYTLPIVYLTKFTDDKTYRRALKTGPCDFLNKPISDLPLSRAIELAIASYNRFKKDDTTKKDFIYIKAGGLQRKFYLSELVLIEADSAYCSLIAADRTYKFSKSLLALFTEVKDLAPGFDDFMRIHRSFVVNLQHVESHTSKYVVINGREIAIGKTHAPAVLQALKGGL